MQLQFLVINGEVMPSFSYEPCQIAEPSYKILRFTSGEATAEVPREITLEEKVE